MQEASSRTKQNPAVGAVTDELVLAAEQLPLNLVFF